MANSKTISADFWPTAKSGSFLDRAWARVLPSTNNGSIGRVRSESWSSGSIERGNQLLQGSYNYNGMQFEFPKLSIWDIKNDAEGLHETLQSFGWLDDLAAIRSPDAIAAVHKWTFDWLNRFGSGRGAGWSPLIASRRATRIAEHWNLLAVGKKEHIQSLSGAINRHAVFLRRRVKSEPMDSRRIEVLARLIRLDLAVGGYGKSVSREARMLVDACSRIINTDGGIYSRNPEELLRIGLLLTWVCGELSSAGVFPPAEIQGAISKIAPVLRSLRHKSGELPRFHGGGAAGIGRLDSFLSSSGSRALTKSKLAMGYARLVGGGVNIIVDAAPPPSGWASKNGHASTLAFEMHSGNCPLIVNCGNAERIAAQSDVAWRETAFHSTVEVDGCSSSRLASPLAVKKTERDILVLVPKNVSVEQLPGKDGQTLIASHDGYRSNHGLTHMRRLDLDGLGRRLWGEDTIWPKTSEDRKIFGESAGKRLFAGFDCLARFHLHFGVEAEISSDGSEVNLALENGEEWRFQYSGDARIELRESAYFDELSCSARNSRQIVLASFVSGAASQVRWSFEKKAGEGEMFGSSGYA